MTVIALEFDDPIRVFAPMAGLPWAMLLDCPTDDPERGRYAYIAVEPTATLLVQDGQAPGGDPFARLSEMLKDAPAWDEDCPVPFRGGAVGLLGYEAGRYLDRVPTASGDGFAQPEIAVGIYDAILAFDRVDRKAWAIGCGPKGAAKARRWAEARIPPLPEIDTFAPVRWRPDFSRAAYLDRVRRIIDYIRAGDVYQVNFTQRFMAPRPPGCDDFSLYRALRAVNPAPFAAYLKLPGFTLASASPERFLRLSAVGGIEARPVKGTRARSHEHSRDRAQAEDLIASAKDRAENLMITDLLRNDIGRVAEIGSVRVPKLAGLESFASLHHLVSVIEGRLRPGLGAVDLLRAAFPGGSITGAPKLRAMEIIAELEGAKRGAYCGSVFWIGWDGAMDSNIVIRSLVMNAAQVMTQAGGGIVADSDPESEWREMMDKAAPALSLLGGCDDRLA